MDAASIGVGIVVFFALLAVALVALTLLDVRGSIHLGHPVWVVFSACAYLVLSVLSAVIMLAALVGTLQEAYFAPALWGIALFSWEPGTLFGLYVLIKANRYPLGWRGGPAERKALRLLDDGLALGIPLQIVLVGGYFALAVLVWQAVEGPVWMLPFYPLLLPVVWSVLHLVFHTALVAFALDPVLLLLGLLTAVLWTAQSIFLIHGTIRSGWMRDRSALRQMGRILLCLVPVVNLVLALRLRFRLRRRLREGVSP